MDRRAAIVEASTVRSVKHAQSIYKTAKTSVFVITTLLVAWLPYFVVILAFEARIAESDDTDLSETDTISGRPK